MAAVNLYADIHDSEKYAEFNAKKIASQNPEALILESDVHGKKASYLMSSLGNFNTLGKV